MTLVGPIFHAMLLLNRLQSWFLLVSSTSSLTLLPSLSSFFLLFLLPLSSSLLPSPSILPSHLPLLFSPPSPLSPAAPHHDSARAHTRQGDGLRDIVPTQSAHASHRSRPQHPPSPCHMAIATSRWAVRTRRPGAPLAQIYAGVLQATENTRSSHARGCCLNAVATTHGWEQPGRQRGVIGC